MSALSDVSPSPYHRRERSQKPASNERERYLREFMAEIDRQLPRLNNFRRQEADDLRSYMCLWLLERPHLMSAYHPRALVAASIRQRAVDFYRSMARQVPQGQFDAEQGGMAKPLMWLDAPVQDFDRSPAAAPRVTAVSSEDEVVSSMMMGALLTHLSPRQRQVFILVDLDGHTVVQAARALGVRREWAQRALGRARRSVREQHTLTHYVDSDMWTQKMDRPELPA